MSWQALLLDESDNVAVLMRAAAQGAVLVIHGPEHDREITTLEPIALCHKVAVADIAAGAPVVKYGQCIGEARVAIARGAWVHTHNLVSRRARVDTR